MKNTKSLISLFLIFSFIYLIMCPFAQAITSGNGSPVSISQNQLVENHSRQKDHLFTPLNFFTKCQINILINDKKITSLPTTTHQEPAFSLSIITTIRLII